MRIEHVNGGTDGPNCSSAQFWGCEFDWLAVSAYEDAQSFREAVRHLWFAESGRTALAPRSQPTAAYCKCAMTTLSRPARRLRS